MSKQNQYYQQSLGQDIREGGGSQMLNRINREKHMTRVAPSSAGSSDTDIFGFGLLLGAIGGGILGYMYFGVLGAIAGAIVGGLLGVVLIIPVMLILTGFMFYGAYLFVMHLLTM